MAVTPLKIDREKSAARIERDIETLAGPEFTSSRQAICRYAYTDAYRATLDYFRGELESLGCRVREDAVGNLVGRNCPPGEPAFAIGSHCDSNRNGGKYDGTLGVATALEVLRLNADLRVGLPLQLISFMEEEASGFGEMLLGSRIVAQRVTDDELRAVRALDDGRTFAEHAREAGYAPERWRECAHILDGLMGWIEVHIEQGRVLEDAGIPLGVVTAIAGYVHADVTIDGRADHAGATPMDSRLDPAPVAGAVVLELERLARTAGDGTVATVGEIDVLPGIRNVIPESARVSLDIRGINDDAFRGVARDIVAFAHTTAGARGLQATYSERQSIAATPMDRVVVRALEDAAQACGHRYRRMASGAAHDTMCVADRVRSAMLFVPCHEGISHSPLESARPGDAAVAAEVALNAIRALSINATSNDSMLETNGESPETRQGMQ
jgi:hydantoinase/carbamoylase family amidase